MTCFMNSQKVITTYFDDAITFYLNSAEYVVHVCCVHACMCVCVVCMYVCTYVCVCVVCMHVRMCVYVCCVHACVCTSMHAHLCLYILM